MKKRNINRWLVVIGAVLIQLCIGAIYSWSLFNQPLMDKFGWDENHVVLTYSIAIFVFAFATIFSGRLMDRIGPRQVAMIGGLFYGTGLILASTATSIMQLYIYYGIIAGIGVGFVYVCPLSTCIKWFPEMKGFITGIAVGSFGLGSLVFKSIIQSLLAAHGVSRTFLYLGIIYFLLVELGAQFLILPHEAHQSKSVISVSNPKTNNFSVSGMLKTRSFYLIWVTYLLGTISGLLVIGHAKDIGVHMAGLDPNVAANAVTIIGLFNAGGRLTWGTLSDKFGRKKVLLVLFVITTLGMVGLNTLKLDFVTFFLCVAAIAFSFGGFLVVMPLVTQEFYGMKNFGANYGIVYQAYGLAALTGPIIVSFVGGIESTFIILAILSAIGAAMILKLKSPKITTLNSGSSN